MTLDKHKLDGIAQITSKTLPTDEFEALLFGAGYSKLGSAPAKVIGLRCGGRIPHTDALNQFTVQMELLRLPLTMLLREVGEDNDEV